MKNRLAMLLLASVSFFGVGCDDSSGGGDGGGGNLQCDAGVVDADAGICSQPCNPGNELGVGKYCDDATDCAGTAAIICAHTVRPGQHFCLRVCSMAGNDPACGTGATCACDPGGGGCGCVPNYCF